MIRTRTLRFDGQTYRVTRIYSSGTGGAQFALTRADSKGGRTKTILVSEDAANRDPKLLPLLEACRKAFDDNMTFHKHPGTRWTPSLKTS